MSEPKPIISYDDFAKLDLRIAKVVQVEAHPNADKLIVMKIDLGGEQRQIIAGLRPWYEPEQLLGKNLVVVANLQPRKMRGLESQGMLLATTAGEGEGMSVVILSPEQDVPPGSPVS